MISTLFSWLTPEKLSKYKPKLNLETFQVDLPVYNWFRPYLYNNKNNNTRNSNEMNSSTNSDGHFVFLYIDK